MKEREESTEKELQVEHTGSQSFILNTVQMRNSAYLEPFRQQIPSLNRKQIIRKAVCLEIDNRNKQRKSAPETPPSSVPPGYQGDFLHEARQVQDQPPTPSHLSPAHPAEQSVDDFSDFRRISYQPRISSSLCPVHWPQPSVNRSSNFHGLIHFPRDVPQDVPPQDQYYMSIQTSSFNPYTHSVHQSQTAAEHHTHSMVFSPFETDNSPRFQSNPNTSARPYSSFSEEHHTQPPSEYYQSSSGSYSYSGYN